MFKVKNVGKPVYLNNKVSKSFAYNTRAAGANNIVNNEKISKDLTKEANHGIPCLSTKRVKQILENLSKMLENGSKKMSPLN